MVLVEQLDKEGCAIACMAMVLGYDYYTMRRRLDTHADMLSGWGKPHFDLMLKPYPIMLILENFGIKTTYIKWKPENLLCILFITSVKQPEITHAVLCTDGMICDPMFSDPQPLSHLDNYHVYCCIGVNDVAPS